MGSTICALTSVTAPCGREWIISVDGEVMRQTGGSVIANIEDKEGLAAAWGVDSKDRTKPGILSYLPERLPTPAQCKGIGKVLFYEFSHETMCLYGIGKKGTEWAGKLIFFVPPQKVAHSNVHMKNGGMDEFVKVARVLGDMHSHPWQGSPSMSGTDDEDMKKFPGLHAIFSSAEGNNGYHVTWYGSVHRLVQEIGRWNIKEAQEEDVVVLTCDGSPIADQMEPLYSMSKHGSYSGRSTGYCGVNSKGYWLNGKFHEHSGVPYDSGYSSTGTLFHDRSQIARYEPDMDKWTEAQWVEYMDGQFPQEGVLLPMSTPLSNRARKYANKQEREKAKAERKAGRKQQKENMSTEMCDEIVKEREEEIAELLQDMHTRGEVEAVGRWFESETTEIGAYSMGPKDRYVIVLVDVLSQARGQRGFNPTTFVCTRELLEKVVVPELQKLGQQEGASFTVWAEPLGDLTTVLRSRRSSIVVNSREGGVAKYMGRIIT